MGTDAFPALTRALGLPQVIDILRITADDQGFDVVFRIYDEGSNRHLGPMLCIGDTVLTEKARQWPSNALLRLRPRLTFLRDDVPIGVIVERVVQWCKSPGFRPVRVKPTGSLWVDHGQSSQ